MPTESLNNITEHFKYMQTLDSKEPELQRLHQLLKLQGKHFAAIPDFEYKYPDLHTSRSQKLW